MEKKSNGRGSKQCRLYKFCSPSLQFRFVKKPSLSSLLGFLLPVAHQHSPLKCMSVSRDFSCHRRRASRCVRRPFDRAHRVDVETDLTDRLTSDAAVPLT